MLFFYFFILEHLGNGHNMGKITSLEMWFLYLVLPKVKFVILSQIVNHLPTYLSNSIKLGLFRNKLKDSEVFCFWNKGNPSFP